MPLLLPFHQKEGSRPRVAKACDVFCDGSEDRCHVVLRFRGYPQHITNSSLPSQRFLRVIEQLSVLNGDDSLVGKRLQQANKLVRRFANLCSAEAQSSNGTTVVNEGDGDKGPVVFCEKDM